MIVDLFRALQAGKELANAETWKKAQLWTANLAILLGAAVSIAASLGYPIPLTADQITTLVSAVAVLVGVFNSYVTVASTTRLGVQPGAGPDDTGTPDRGGHAAVPRGPEQWLRELDDRAARELPDLDRFRLS